MDPYACLPGGEQLNSLQANSFSRSQDKALQMGKEKKQA